MRGLSTTTRVQNQKAPWYQNMEQNGLGDKEDPQLYCLKWMMRSEEESSPEKNRSAVEAGMRENKGMADWMCKLNEIREERLQAANEPQELPVVNKMQDLQLRSFGRGRERHRSTERKVERDTVVFEKCLRDVSFERGVAIDADYRGDEDLSYDYDEDVCGKNAPVNLKPKPQVNQVAAITRDMLPGPSAQIVTPANKKEEPNSGSLKVMNVVYSALNPSKFQCLTRHPVSYLNELANFLKLGAPKYSNVEGGTLPVGNVNKAWFVCTVRLNNVNSVGIGRGWNKKDSKSRAAAIMISEIGRGRSDVNKNQFSDYLEQSWELDLRDIPEQYVLGYKGGSSSSSSEHDTTSVMPSSAESGPVRKLSEIAAERRKVVNDQQNATKGTPSLGALDTDIVTVQCKSQVLGKNAVDEFVQSELGNITTDKSTVSEMTHNPKTADVSRHHESRSTVRKRIQSTGKVENIITTCRRAADFSCEPREDSTSKPSVLNPAQVIVTAKRPDATGWYVTVSVAADANGTSQQEACRNAWVLIKEMAEEVLKEMEGSLPSPSKTRVSAVE